MTSFQRISAQACSSLHGDLDVSILNGNIVRIYIISFGLFVDKQSGIGSGISESEPEYGRAMKEFRMRQGCNIIRQDAGSRFVFLRRSFLRVRRDRLSITESLAFTAEVERAFSGSL